MNLNLKRVPILFRTIEVKVTIIIILMALLKHRFSTNMIMFAWTVSDINMTKCMLSKLIHHLENPSEILVMP